MLTLRSHKERLAAGSQPVVGLLCTRQGQRDWSAVAVGYALVGIGTSDRPATSFPMNPEVGR